MKTRVIRGDSGNPLYIHRSGSSALVNFSSASKGSAGSANAGSPAIYKAAAPSTEEEEGKKEWIPWGTNDDFPKQVAKLIRKSTVGRAGLQLLTKSIYGQRTITYKIKDVTDSGKEVIELVSVPEWEEIKRRSNFDMMRLALTQDYAYYGIIFPQVRFNGNKTKIWAFDWHKASHCRLAPCDVNTGRIPLVYVSGNFPDAKAADCQKIPVIDGIRFFDQLEEIKADLKNFKYVMPLGWPDVLNDYYPVVYWDSSRESGHLDIATSIPAYKKALFKNQMSLKYDIQIPFEYLEDRYSGWKSMGLDQQDDLIEELYNEIIDNLTGAENAQKALLSFFRSGKDGKPSGQWVIKTIDDKMKNDAYLPDAAAANSEILFSMLINPATIGQGNTGGDYTGGSNNGGSNIRESGLQLRSLLKADRDIIHGFFNFFKEFSGIDPAIQIGVQDMVLTTLDQGKGTEKVMS